MIAKDIIEQIYPRKKIQELYDNNNDIRAFYFKESRFTSKVYNIFIEEEYIDYAQGHLTCLLMDWFLKRLLSLSRQPNSHIEYGDPVYIEDEKKESITCLLSSNGSNEKFTIYNQKIKNKTIIGINANQKAIDKVFPELDRSFTNTIFEIEIVKTQIDSVNQIRVHLPLRNFDFNDFFENLKGVGLCEYYFDGFSFSQGDMLGHGGFGCVAIVQKKDERAYALKLIFHCIKGRIDISQLAMKEMHLGGKISNDYIADCYDTNVRFCYIPNNVAYKFGLNSNIRCCLAFSMKMEYIKGKTIESLCEDKNYQETIQLEDSGKSISKYFTEENRAFSILWDVANALLYLESNNALHRDISIDNIMIRKEKFQTIVIDLSLARLEKAGNVSIQQYFGFELGKSEYFPPESIFQHEHTIKYDVYSLGIVLFYMLFGRTPGETKGIIFTRLGNQGIRFNTTKNWKIDEFLKNMHPEEYYNCLGIPTLPPPYKEYSDLLRYMLHPNPEIRYSPQDIINYTSNLITNKDHRTKKNAWKLTLDDNRTFIDDIIFYLENPASQEFFIETCSSQLESDALKNNVTAKKVEKREIPKNHQIVSTSDQIRQYVYYRLTRDNLRENNRFGRYSFKCYEQLPELEIANIKINTDSVNTNITKSTDGEIQITIGNYKDNKIEFTLNCKVKNSPFIVLKKPTRIAKIKGLEFPAKYLNGKKEVDDYFDVSFTIDSYLMQSNYEVNIPLYFLHTQDFEMKLALSFQFDFLWDLTLKSSSNCFDSILGKYEKWKLERREIPDLHKKLSSIKRETEEYFVEDSNKKDKDKDKRKRKFIKTIGNLKQDFDFLENTLSKQYAFKPFYTAFYLGKEDLISTKEKGINVYSWGFLLGLHGQSEFVIFGPWKDTPSALHVTKIENNYVGKLYKFTPKLELLKNDEQKKKVLANCMWKIEHFDNILKEEFKIDIHQDYKFAHQSGNWFVGEDKENMIFDIQTLYNNLKNVETENTLNENPYSVEIIEIPFEIDIIPLEQESNYICLRTTHNDSSYEDYYHLPGEYPKDVFFYKT